MFFIFGWGHQMQTNDGPVEERECANCNNTKYWLLGKVSNWFTLFFIPVIPYKTTRYTHCPICGNSEILSKEQYEMMKPLADLNSKAAKSNMTDEEYQAHLNKMK